MASRIVALLLAIIWLTSPLYSQSWDDLARARPVNFDKVISGTDKMIYIEPPAGKFWVIVQGTLILDRILPNVTVTVFTQAAPFHPMRDPITGVMRGCDACVSILRADASRFAFIPIVGGYGTNADGVVLHGQTLPIVVAHPDRLVIFVTPPHGGHPFPFWTRTRLSVVEKNLD